MSPIADATPAYPRPTAPHAPPIPAGYADLGDTQYHEARRWLSAKGQPLRFRLIRCADYAAHERVHLFERLAGGRATDPAGTVPFDMPSPGVKYAVLSTSSLGPGGGAHGAPGSWVLRLACKAAQALYKDIQFLWYDRACVLQDDGGADWRWHAAHLGEIYGAAALCIVVPGDVREIRGQLFLEGPVGVCHVHTPSSLLEACCAADAEAMLQKAMVLHRWDWGTGRWTIPRKDTTDIALMSVRTCVSDGATYAGKACAEAIFDDKTSEKTRTYALSPLIYLLQGALDGLRFTPAMPSQGIGVDYASKIWYPQLFGPTAAFVDKQRATMPGIPTAQSSHRCDDCIRLLLDTMVLQISIQSLSVREPKGSMAKAPLFQSFKDALLVGALTREYSAEADIVHVMRAALHTLARPMRLIFPQAQAEDKVRGAPLAVTTTRGLLALMSLNIDTNSVPPFWLWIPPAFCGGASSDMKDMPLFGSVLLHPAQDERSPRVVSPRELRSPSIFYKYRFHEFVPDVDCKISKYVSDRSGCPGVEFTARMMRTDPRLEPRHTTPGPGPSASLADKEKLYAYVGRWRLPETKRFMADVFSEDWPTAVIMELTQRAATPESACYVHSGWDTIPAAQADRAFRPSKVHAVNILLGTVQGSASSRPRKSSPTRFREDINRTSNVFADTVTRQRA